MAAGKLKASRLRWGIWMFTDELYPSRAIAECEHENAKLRKALTDICDAAKKMRAEAAEEHWTSYRTGRADGAADCADIARAALPN